MVIFESAFNREWTQMNANENSGNTSIRFAFVRVHSRLKTCLRNYRAPLSPEIRTVKLSNLTKLTPNFWGEGLGVRGKPLVKKPR